jgi:hypothetical protein
MKHFALLIFISITGLISPSALAQDYQAFKSSDVHYYRENIAGLILASQIDSSEFISGDSIFYPFRSLRFGGPLDFIEKPGWMGEKIIIKDNGINLFFNEASDTIFIDTQVNLGETFTFYTFESGTTVEATVTSITEELVFDVLDSVKTYELSSDEPDFDFETPSFRIGKTSGLMDIYPFYTFPHKYAPINGPVEINERYELAGQLYPKKGITKPSLNDLNNLEIGDIIQYETYYTLNLITVRLTILGKTFIDPENVEYEIERHQNHHFDGVSAEYPDYDSLSTITFIDTFSITEAFATPQLIPEKDYGLDISEDDYYTDYTLALYYNEPCGYHEFFKSWGSQRSDSTGIIFEPTIRSRSIYSHALYTYTTYYHNTGTDIYDSGAIFKSTKHGELICGEGIFLGLDEMVKNEQLLVYPNPSNGNFKIDLEGIYKLQLFSLDGRMVYAESNLSDQGMTRVDFLPNGTYFLVISQNGLVYNQKVVINK